MQKYGSGAQNVRFLCSARTPSSSHEVTLVDTYMIPNASEIVRNAISNDFAHDR